MPAGMANFFNRFTNRWRSEDTASTNEFSMPAARLANGARSPPALHINGIHRQTPELQKKDDIDSPVMITSGKFSPPPYLFEGLRNPFSETWCSDTSKEDATSLNSLGLKELSRASTLERHAKIRNDNSLDDDEIDDDEEQLWPLPPPPPKPSSEPPKQKPPLAPKPPVPPMPPSSAPYAIPNIIPSTSTLTRRHHSQYAQPSIQSGMTNGPGELQNSDASAKSPTSKPGKDDTPTAGNESMLFEIDKTFKEISEQKTVHEIKPVPSSHSPPKPPDHSPPPIPANAPLESSERKLPTETPPTPPPLPPPTLPISPLSSPPTTPPDSPPSSPALSPQTSSPSSETQPSSSPNSPPHFLLNWR